MIVEVTLNEIRTLIVREVQLLDKKLSYNNVREELKEFYICMSHYLPKMRNS